MKINMIKMAIIEKDLTIRVIYIKSENLNTCNSKGYN